MCGRFLHCRTNIELSLEFALMFCLSSPPLHSLPSLPSPFTGCYHRRNLNMPREVPRRSPKEFVRDSPVTEMGLYQARLTGMGLRQQGVVIHHVFCSPALRCVQTADAILEGLQADHSVTIKVENGLFEWLAWCQGEEWVLG